MQQTKPFLLHFLEDADVTVHDLPPYDPEIQSREVPVWKMGGTKRTHSWRNQTTNYSWVTNWEDLDDEMVTKPD